MVATYPSITYRQGASGVIAPILLGTGIRVQTIVIASHNMTQTEIANDYDLIESQVREALAFYDVHRSEIDALIQIEVELELKNLPNNS